MSDWRPRPSGDASGAPRLGDLIDATLLVPIRSSSGVAPAAARTPSAAFRHGTDASGPSTARMMSATEISAAGRSRR